MLGWPSKNEIGAHYWQMPTGQGSILHGVKDNTFGHLSYLRLVQEKGGVTNSGEKVLLRGQNL